MDTTNTQPLNAHALTSNKAWLVGGGLALVAAGSLATALVLKAPGSVTASTQAEPRETIVSTLSPAPRGSHTARATAATATPATAAAKPTPAACTDCAVVESVVAVERGEKPSGLGAVAGAVAGGVLGHQMGGGSGKDAMTVIGAVGGGVAGHAIERRARTTTEYRVRVKMADGSSRTLSHPNKLSAGDKVRVEGERLVALARPAAAPAPSTPTATRTAERDPEAARPRSMAEAKRL